jgi:hypothetical protein
MVATCCVTDRHNTDLLEILPGPLYLPRTPSPPPWRTGVRLLSWRNSRLILPIPGGPLPRPADPRRTATEDIIMMDLRPHGALREQRTSPTGTRDRGSPFTKPMREAPASWERSRNRAGWPCSGVAPRHVPTWRGLESIRLCRTVQGTRGCESTSSARLGRLGAYAQHAG